MYTLETLKSLFENAFDNFFLDAIGEAIVNNGFYATFSHKTHGNVKFVAGHPAATDPEDIGMLGETHELGFAHEEPEGAGRERVEVEDFDCAFGGWCGGIVVGRIDGGGRAKADRGTDGVVLGTVAEERGEVNGTPHEVQVDDGRDT